MSPANLEEMPLNFSETGPKLEEMVHFLTDPKMWKSEEQLLNNNWTEHLNNKYAKSLTIVFFMSKTYIDLYMSLFMYF